MCTEGASSMYLVPDPREEDSALGEVDFLPGQA